MLEQLLHGFILIGTKITKIDAVWIVDEDMFKWPFSVIHWLKVSKIYSWRLYFWGGIHWVLYRHISEQNTVICFGFITPNIIISHDIITNTLCKFIESIECFTTFDIITKSIEVSGIIQELIYPGFVLWCGNFNVFGICFECIQRRKANYENM